jgi:diguanylate cyclase (GGDEF)-like protein
LLRRVTPTPQSLAARYGGDEFVVALPESDLDHGVEVAEGLRTEILYTTFCAEPGEIQPEPIHLNGLTCSVGVASLRRHIRDELSIERCKSTLLRLSDAAMYVAKETGRNRTAIAGEPIRRRQASGD